MDRMIESLISRYLVCKLDDLNSWKMDEWIDALIDCWICRLIKSLTNRLIDR